MKTLSQNQLLEANDRFTDRMYALEKEGAPNMDEARQLAARQALIECAPWLVGNQDQPIQVEAYRCEGMNLDGVTTFEEVTYRGVHRATIAVRQTDTDASSGLTMVRYGFMVRVEPEFDRVTDQSLVDNAVLLADFPNIERLTFHNR